MGYSLIYITASGRDEGLRLARALVESRLVACVNLMDGVTSLYWWEGRVQEDAETVLICKTRSTLVEAVITRVKELHTYACPCVVAIPIVDGNPAYLDWIGTETAP